MGFCDSENCESDEGNIPSRVDLSPAQYNGRDVTFVYLLNSWAESYNVPGYPIPAVAQYLGEAFPWNNANAFGTVA